MKELAVRGIGWRDAQNKKKSFVQRKIIKTIAPFMVAGGGSIILISGFRFTSVFDAITRFFIGATLIAIGLVIWREKN